VAGPATAGTDQRYAGPVTLPGTNRTGRCGHPTRTRGAVATTFSVVRSTVPVSR
jgi:hypothetical protein